MLIKHHRKILLLILIILFSVSITNAQEDFTLTGNYTISENESEEYENLNLTTNSSHLIVNGTLIVHGNLDMSGNKSQFTMGSSAVVIVYGNFIGSNKVDISISSYLIVQGNFTRRTGSNQSNIDIDNGNVYIFGEVDGWQDEFTSCDDYNGNTSGVSNEECEYGTESDYEDNIEDFPSEIADKLNCFNLTNPEDQTSCEGNNVVFNIQTSTSRNVSYQWQVKASGSDAYTDIVGANTINLSLNNITNDMGGNLYRVKIRAEETGSGCKVSISKPAALIIDTVFDWTGALGSDWNNPGNWLCNTIPNINSNTTISSGLTNYPIISSGGSATVNNLTIESGATLEISDNNLEIYGSISNNGEIIANAGTLVMKGSSSAQSLPSGLFRNNRILNLEIDNLNSVISNTTIELSGWLKLTNGNLFTNDDFTLISNAAKTALIDGSGNGEIIGNVSMQRYIDPAFGYKYFGSPFSNTTVGDFSSYVDLNSEFPSVFKYMEDREDADGNDLSGWEAYTNSVSGFNILEGYALNFGTAGGELILDINGTVNNGDVTRNLNTSNGDYTKGFHLVSNPYPSPIDWNMIPSLSTNIDNAAYFFRADATDEYGGAYTSYVADISSSGTGGSIVPSMQGFFIHASDGTSSSVLRMNNGVRVNDFSQEFYKNQVTVNEPGLIRISAGFGNKNYSDPLVIYFNNNLSLDFDRENDALKLYNSNKDLPNFYSITNDGKETSINGMPAIDSQNKLRIPLGIKTEKQGRLNIKLEDLENIEEDIQVFLIDQERRVSVNLKEENYSLNLEKGTYKNRFFLSFSPDRFPDPSILFNDPFSLMDTSEKIGVRMHLNERESGHLRISNINGQLLKLIQVTGGEDINFSNIQSTGIYLVTFISNLRQFSKKVIVRK
ncbi:T9SS type A sorting domain-containing protein [Gramella sp. MAR_2010_147]|uniref:T9SS type A sorting domain-containing protein n=1 Tax=Gramella sp. MAR_2010_147 TaxID=1250205 RepID=UPI00087A5D17|nr:T9SS type A sorting domain-containing protein [Gramella sp. MAR_2010_147]SDR80180.1 Por secretion system C-terminal sorting domain-containing protein [Gramella sp. MAR_2010_147]